MDTSEIYEDDGLFETMEENGNFQRAFEHSASVESFLNRREKVYARSVVTERAEQHVFLGYSTDVDGCVVELRSWKGIRMPVRHITICEKNVTSVRLMKSQLKKHIDLTRYSADQIRNFNNCVGFQLFYEAGWEGWFGVVPRMNRRGPELGKDVIKNISYEYFQTIKAGFQRRLFGLRDRALRTLMKNDINDVSKLFVLPDDCVLILRELQTAIDDCNLHGDFEAISYCFRFGEKASEGVSLSAFHKDEIIRSTVHSAMDISSEYMDLMWSMVGLQGVVGTRGVLNTCLSFSDCGNFQSNLDGRLMDIKRELRNVCNHPDKLRFIQLYVDVPHLRPRTRGHPVSGCIVGGMVFAPATTASFERDANRYISSLETNYALMQKSTCRIEIVTEAMEMKDNILATDALNVDKVFSLLVQHPMLVPFPLGTMKCLQNIGLYITGELKLLLEKCSRTGNVEATWQALQLELSAEKMLWGHPLCFRCYNYAVNLGPGVMAASRSLTDHLGFLTLERWSACMAYEDSVPECRIWTGSELVGKKILRTVGIHDVLDSSSFVLGRRLLHALINDFFEVGNVSGFMRLEEFKRQLFSEHPTLYKVCGAVTLKQLVHILCAKRRVPPMMVFRVLCQLVEKSNHDLATIMKDGFDEIGLKHFPALQTHDTHDNSVLKWTSKSGLFKIVSTEESSSQFRKSAALLSTLVCAELEMRQLVYVSKLKTVATTLPWIWACARKLTCEKLCENDLVLILTFISCIGLMMNGWFVDFESLETLMADLPINQYRLKDIEILSKLLMSYFNKFKLFRLHHSIPSRMTSVHPIPTTQQSVENETAAQLNENVNHGTECRESVTRINEEENICCAQDVSCRAPTCVPTTIRTTERWSPKEIELLHEISMTRRHGQNVRQLFNAFKQKCIDNHVPFRTLKAFEHKLNRL